MIRATAGHGVRANAVPLGIGGASQRCTSGSTSLPKRRRLFSATSGGMPPKLKLGYLVAFNQEVEDHWTDVVRDGIDYADTLLHGVTVRDDH